MSVPHLRVITFLCPSIPVEFFQQVLEYLEEKIKLNCTLQYEWRSDGPLEKHDDPFERDLVDLAFLPSSGYIKLESKQNEFAELLPVTPIFKHPKNEELSVGTYIDIIVHVDKLKQNVCEVGNLRGCRWAVTKSSSLAKCVTASILKELGENTSFFGSCHSTESHLEAVNLVLSKKVEAAAIDAAALTCNRALLHAGAKDVATLASYGPFSPYAVVVNSRLSNSLKQNIVHAFQNIVNHSHLAKFGFIQFAENSTTAYDIDKKLASDIGLKLGKVPYY